MSKHARTVVGRAIEGVLRRLLPQQRQEAPVLGAARVEALEARQLLTTFTASILVLDDAGTQRSMVRSITCQFSEPVTIDAGAFSIVSQSGSPSIPVAATPIGDGSTIKLTFSGSLVIGDSLPDGIWDLSVDASKITDFAGDPLSTGNQVVRFHRLFGDGDGNGIVDETDYALIVATLGRLPGDPLFNSAFDYEGNNLINALDLARFRLRLGLSYTPTPTIPATGSASAAEGDTYTLTLPSTAPDGAPATQWVIDWGDGSLLSTIPVDPTTPLPTHVYPDGPATHTIRAMLSDGTRSYLSNPKTVSITNIAPTVSVVPDAANVYQEGLPLQFHATSTDPAGALDPRTYFWTVTRNGQPYPIPSELRIGADWTFTPADSGTYVVSVTADDGDGGQATYTLDAFAVANVTPTLSVSGAATAREMVPYTLNLLTDNAAAAGTWLVDWGDGSDPDQDGVIGQWWVATATTTLAWHQYDQPDRVYHVCVSAQDEGQIWRLEQGIAYSDTVAAVDPSALPVLVPGAAGVVGILGTADDSYVSIPLGARQVYAFGTTYTGATGLWVSPNGDLRFGAGTATAPGYLPLGRDLVTNRSSTDQVLYRFDDLDSNGTADRLIIQWHQVTPYNNSTGLTSATFQVVLPLDSATAPTYFNYIAVASGYALDANIGVTSPGFSRSFSATERTQILSSPHQITWQPLKPTLSVAVNSLPVRISGAGTAKQGFPYQLNLNWRSYPADTRWTVDWGDGTTTRAYGNVAELAHAFVSPSTAHQVKVTGVAPDNTLLESNTISVAVSDVVKGIELSGDTISAKGSTAYVDFRTIDLEATVSSWFVCWGDGTISEVAGTDTYASHVYAHPAAAFTVMVAATLEGTATGMSMMAAGGEGDDVRSDPHQIEVADVPPTLALAGGTAAYVGKSFTLSLSATGVGADSISKWIINWGDGPSENVSGNPSQVTHTYTATPAELQITASVQNADGVYACPDALSLTLRPWAKDNTFWPETYISNAFVHDYTVQVPAAHGLLAGITTGGSATVVRQVEHGSLVVAADGSFIYTPDAGYLGTDGFAYQITVNGIDSNVGTIRFDVGHARYYQANGEHWFDISGGLGIYEYGDFYWDANTAFDSAVGYGSYTPPGGYNGIDRLLESFEVGRATLELVSGPQHGTVEFRNDGTYVYTPTDPGSFVDYFVYRKTDGIDVGSPCTIAIAVERGNQDADGHAVYVAKGITVGSQNLVAVAGVPAEAGPYFSHGQLQTLSDGQRYYVPNAGFAGWDLAAWDETVEAGGGGTTTVHRQTYVYVMAHPWAAPQYQEDLGSVDSTGYTPESLPFITLQGCPTTVDLARVRFILPYQGRYQIFNAPLYQFAANDQIVIVEAPRHGALELVSGTQYRYVPNRDYFGNDYVTYLVKDSSGKTKISMLQTFNVTPAGPGLVIDSNNDGGFEDPLLLSSLAEDAIKDDSSVPGRILAVNDDDSDGDGIADSLDGYNADGIAGNADDAVAGERFVPLAWDYLRSPVYPYVSGVSWIFPFTYNLIPSATWTFTFTGPETDAFRVWTKDGSQARKLQGLTASGDLIEQGVAYTASQLGLSGSGSLRLWVEALKPSTSFGDLRIQLSFDPDGASGPAQAIEDAVRLTAIQAIDLDVDSDNSGGLFDDPQGDAAEDDAEKTAPGAKLLIVSRDDSDSDGILDFADGYGRFGDTAGTDGEQFAHAKLGIPAMPESMRSSVRLVFSYIAAALVDTRTTITTQALDGEWCNRSSYSTGTGLLRLWKKDAYEARTDGDFIESGREYTLAELGISASDMDLFIEAVNGSATSVEIGVTLRLYGSVSSADIVRVLPLDPEVGIDRSQELTGYHIFRGNGSSMMGSEDKDILIGTTGSERIDGLGGDDIIIAGHNTRYSVEVLEGTGYEGDTIVGGSGADVVFCWYGNNTVVVDGDDTVSRADGHVAVGSHVSAQAATTATMGMTAANRVNWSAKEFTSQDIEAAYAWMYGVDDIWMRGFRENGGRVLAVKADGHWFSDWSIDYIRVAGEGPYGVIVGYDVKIEYDIGSVLVAAAALRQAIMNTAWRDSPRWTQFFEGGAGASLTDLTRYGDALEAWTELRGRNFEYAKEVAKTAAELYMNGMLIAAGPGGDVADTIVSITDFLAKPNAEDLLGSLLGMLPLIPGNLRRVAEVAGAGMCSAGDAMATGLSAPRFTRARTAIVTATRRLFELEQDVLYAMKAVGGRMPVGFVLRGDLIQDAETIAMKIRPVFSADRSAVTLVIGTAQEVAGTTHAATILRKAEELAATGNFSHITLARNWRTATGRVGTSSLIPDILAVGRDGKIVPFEIASPGDMGNLPILLGKMTEGMETLPSENQTLLDLATNVLLLDPA